MTVYAYLDFLKKTRSIGSEVVVDEEKQIGVNTKQAKEEWQNLIQGRTEPAEHSRCSICYITYERIRDGRGRLFDKEAFFLDWLANQIWLSKIKIIEKIVYKTPSGKGVYQHSIKPGQKTRGLWQGVSDLIARELPKSGVDTQPGRIRLKVWRLRKSGWKYRVEKTLIAEREKRLGSQPGRLKEAKDEWKKLRFIYRVADFIRNQQSGASRREILRRFSNKKMGDIDEISDVLKFDFDIKFDEAAPGRGRYIWGGGGMGFPYFEAHKDDF